MTEFNMSSNNGDVVVIDKIESTSSVTYHKTYDDNTRHCSKDVVQGSVLSSSPLTSSMTELSTEQHGLIEESIKEAVEISIANPAPISSESRVISIETCRICLDESRKEALISPCECLGSLALMHQSCLERWLGLSNRDTCEICRYKYQTERKPQPLINWLRTSSVQWDLFFKLLCFLVVTGIVGCLAYIGVMALIHTSTSGLRALLIVLLYILALYIAYCKAVCKGIYGRFRDWQRVHHTVKIINLRAQPTSSIVTISDVHASLPTLGINVPAVTNNRRRPPTMGHNQIQPWFWQEIDEGNTLIGDTMVITDTENPASLIVEHMTGEDSPPTPDTYDVVVEQNYSCSPSLSPKNSDEQNQLVIETCEVENAVVPLIASQELAEGQILPIPPNKLVDKEPQFLTPNKGFRRLG